VSLDPFLCDVAELAEIRCAEIVNSVRPANLCILDSVDKSVGQRLSLQRRFAASRLLHQPTVLSDFIAESVHEWTNRKEIVEPPAGG